VKIRPLEGADLPALGAFKCATTTGSYAHEAERFIRTELFLRARDAGADAWVVDDDGEIVAACAFEQDDDDEDLNCEVWYVIVLGVRVDRQGGHLGRDLLDAVLNELASRSPGGYAYWMCGVKNARAHSVSRALNAEPDPPIGGMVRYYLTLGYDPTIT
jgi:ribosomal protein S18 acetylase RimI-like enzyme